MVGALVVTAAPGVGPRAAAAFAFVAEEDVMTVALPTTEGRISLLMGDGRTSRQAMTSSAAEEEEDRGEGDLDLAPWKKARGRIRVQVKGI